MNGGPKSKPNLKNVKELFKNGVAKQTAQSNVLQRGDKVTYPKPSEALSAAHRCPAKEVRSIKGKP